MMFPYSNTAKLANIIATAMLMLHLSLSHAQEGQLGQIRVIEVLADHDSRYKIAGLKQPEINVKAGEQVVLRITAKKAKNMNREGAIHGFTLLRAHDQKAVEGWDFALQPGTQEFSVTAPSEPGEYIVVCTVICSDDHEGMKMKFVVSR